VTESKVTIDATPAAVALAMVMSADELEALAAKLKAARDAEKRAGEWPGVGAERLADGHLAIAPHGDCPTSTRSKRRLSNAVNLTFQVNNNGSTSNSVVSF
jgi:hypothetical protein